jgi:alkaline phosphatase D
MVITALVAVALCFVPIESSVVLSPSLPLSRLAFASCNHHDQEQPLWDDVVDYKPDAFLWLGDIVYADTREHAFKFVRSSLDVVRGKYESQRNHPSYVRMVETTPHVLGIWDDHDYVRTVFLNLSQSHSQLLQRQEPIFLNLMKHALLLYTVQGINDGGASNPDKDAVKEILMQFLDEPVGSERRQRKGIYESYLFGPPDSRVRMILLDTRYFATDIPRGDRFRGRIPPDADILGKSFFYVLEG